MRHLFLTFFLYLICTALSASVVDSLRNIMNSKQPDIVIAQAYADYALQLHAVYPDSSLIYSEKAIKIGTRLNSKIVLISALNAKSAAMWKLGKLDSSIIFLHQLLEIQLTTTDSAAIAATYRNIGGLNMEMKRYEIAMEWFYKSLAIFEQLKQPLNQARVYQTIGIIYKAKQEYESAIVYWQRALRIFDEYNDIENKVYAINNIASVYTLQNQYDKAIALFKPAVEMSKTINDKSAYITIISNLSNLYFLKKDYVEAEKYYRDGMSKVNEFGFKVLKLNLLYTKSRIDSAQNHMESALFHYQQICALKDSIYNEKNLTVYNEMEERYNKRIAEEEQKNWKLQKLAWEANNNRQKIIIIAISIALIISLLISIYILRSARIIKMKNELLQQKSIEIVTREEIISNINNELHQKSLEIDDKNYRLELKNMELEQHKKNLESKILERTIELEKAKEIAEKNHKIKTAFLTNISHEIRTPTNAIIGLSAYLTGLSVCDEQRDTLQTIQKNTFLLLNIINKITDMSMLDSGQIIVRKDTFKVKKLVEELYREYSLYDIANQETAIGVQLKYAVNLENEEYEIYSDRQLIKQILSNLLENALKFTNSGFVEIGVFQEDSSKNIVLFVKDSGLGINKRNFNSIFEPYWKLQDNNQKFYHGLGIGLAIVKKIATLLNIEIIVESEENKGSEFKIVIKN